MFKLRTLRKPIPINMPVVANRFIYLLVAATLLTSLFSTLPVGSATVAVECPAAPITSNNPDAPSGGAAMAIALPKKEGLPAPSQGINQQIRNSLDASLKYNLLTWFPTCYGQQTGPIKPNGNSEIPVRNQAEIAYATAIALKTGGYDANEVGLSAASATSIAKRLAVGVALSHRINAGVGGWGHNRQTTYWAFLAGTAAWYLSANLTAQERQAAARMVADEANNQISRPAGSRVGYYADRSGKVISPGDTKAEENTWNSSLLGLAVMMIPANPNSNAWRKLQAQDELAAFSRPKDLTSKAKVNGMTVGSFLKGSNILNDGTLINHDIINANYMTAVTGNMNGILSAGMAGKPGLNASMWNSGVVYNAMVNKSFSSPPYSAPGGHIYKKNSSLIYYPQHDLWGTVRVTQFLSFDTLANATKFGAPYGASNWMNLHLSRQLQLQSRFSDGRTYAGVSTDSNAENTYRGREQITAGDLAQIWLTQYLGYNRLLKLTNASL